MILATDGSSREYFVVIEKAILGVVKAQQISVGLCWQRFTFFLIL